MKALSKKSPNQNLFTSIRAERTTLYDPRNRRSSSSSSSATPGTAQASIRKAKKGSSSVSRKQMAKMKVVQVVFPQDDQDVKPSIEENMPGLEESAMSDIDVVDTSPQTDNVAAEEIVHEKQTTTSEEQAIWAEMSLREPFHDHCYTTIFGSLQKYTSGRSLVDPEALDEGSSRTAGVKNTLDEMTPEENEQSRPVMLRVSTGEPPNNDLFIPIVRLSGTDEAPLVAGRDSPKMDVSLLDVAPSVDQGGSGPVSGTDIYLNTHCLILLRSLNLDFSTLARWTDSSLLLQKPIHPCPSLTLHVEVVWLFWTS